MEGFCPLASGSKGNCLYFGTKKTKILIDAGISGKALEKKLNEIRVSLDDIQAILITHEHVDHIGGLKSIAIKNNIPVLANSETAKEILNSLGEYPKFKIFTTEEPFCFGDIHIHPFSVQHDAMDPVAFTLTVDGIKTGICTDLGFPTSLVATRLKNCDYLYIEANHEPSMVHASSRPNVYKQRVLGKSGHLSNESCGQLLKIVFHEELKHIHLAHLSQECNSPVTALKVIQNHIGNDAKVSIAPQDHIAQPIFF